MLLYYALSVFQKYALHLSYMQKAFKLLEHFDNLDYVCVSSQ